MLDREHVRRLVDEEIQAFIHEERTVKTHLKIKIKSLAAEAVIIRQEERKWTKTIDLGPRMRPDGTLYRKLKVLKNHPMRLSLQAHRKGVVRGEARRSLVAYAFMRGRPLKAVDRGLVGDRYVYGGNKIYSRSQFDWAEVQKLIRRFGGNDEGFDAWSMAS